MIESIFAYMKQNFELEREDAIDLVQSYLDTVDDYLPQLEQALELPTWEDIRHIAHSIKGCSANIGAEALRRAAYDLECAAKNTSKTEAMAAYSELKQLRTQLPEKM